MSDTRYPIPDNSKRRTPEIGHRASGIGHRVSGIGYRTSGIGYRTPGIGHRASGIGYRTSGIPYRNWEEDGQTDNRRKALPRRRTYTAAGRRPRGRARRAARDQA